MARASRPAGIEAYTGPPAEVRFEDVVLVFVCVETKDSAENVARAVGQILTFVQNCGLNKDLVIVPFGHLSARLAPPGQARKMLSQVRLLLSREGLVVSEVSFGFHKEFELSFKAFGHEGSVGFRSA